MADMADMADTKRQFVMRGAPYRHLIFAPTLAKDSVAELLATFEEASWIQRSASFYRFSIPVSWSNNSRVLRLIERDLRLHVFKVNLENFFKCHLGDDIKLEVQRYTKGDGIGAHTDCSAKEIRCIININRGWCPEKGAVWVLARNSILQRRVTYLPSLNNSAFVFATGLKSFHALTTCQNDTLYGLVIRIPRL